MIAPDRPRRCDAHRALIRALCAKAGGCDGATIEDARSEVWASATFRGARHGMTLRITGEDAAIRAERLAEEMAGIEFDLPGHLVADIAVIARSSTADGETLEIEALTVEDA
ncbi:MAG: hypothetical protein JWM75_1912 [Sphingomonas bacterium]|nr:hypothetical protein [Sphingomonas bacterium]